MTRNRPPVVKMSQPAHDVRVSPVEELKLKAELEDDFGVVRHGVSYTMAGREPREIVLPARPRPKPGKLRRRAPARLRSLQGRARPARHLFLLGRGHRPRRPAAAHLGRHVLRRGPAFRGDLPPGRTAPERLGRERRARGQEGNAQQAEQLAELQKEIINGTWKLIRRETGGQADRQVRRGRQDSQESQHAVDRAGGPAWRATPRRGLESEPGAGDQS